MGITEAQWAAALRNRPQAQTREVNLGAPNPRPTWRVADHCSAWLFTAPRSWSCGDKHEDGIAKRWKPDPASPVPLDPDQRFGQPPVRGASTSALREYAQDGYTQAETAADFRLAQPDVNWAVAYETDARAA